jgi:RNA polymerase sigma-70 factor (ECF subfamily)
VTEKEADESSDPRADLVGARLMAAVAHGDVRAFEDLYDRYVQSVFGLALRLLRNTQDAEEVVGDVFLTAWRNAASFDPQKGNLVSWLLNTTRRRVIDRWRMRAKAQAVAESMAAAPGPSGAPDPVAEEVLLQANTDDVAMVLDSLPEAQRRALTLAIVYGYTHAEIALMDGLPLGTVKSRVRLGLRRLRGTLAGGGPTAALLDEVLALA